MKKQAQLDTDRAIRVLNSQIKAIQSAQRAAKKAGETDSKPLTSQVMNMVRAIAAIQAETRKAGEEAEESLKSLTPDRYFELVLRLVDDLAPDQRKALGIHLEDLGDKVIAHE